MERRNSTAPTLMTTSKASNEHQRRPRPGLPALAQKTVHRGGTASLRQRMANQEIFTQPQDRQWVTLIANTIRAPDASIDAHGIPGAVSIGSICSSRYGKGISAACHHARIGDPSTAYNRRRWATNTSTCATDSYATIIPSVPTISHGTHNCT